MQHKKRFKFLYAPVTLIDSVYRKNGNYYHKVSLDIYCSNSDEEYYYKKCINLLLENSSDFKVPFPEI